MSKKGVTKLPVETLEVHHANVTRTTVPIIFCPSSKFAEKKAEIEQITDSVSAPRVSPDLAGAGVLEPEHGGEQREDVEQTARSVSPVHCPSTSSQLSQPRSEHAAEIKRQLTFVETSTKVKTNNNSSQTDDLSSEHNSSSKEKAASIVESEAQTEATAPSVEADSQTEDVLEAARPVRDEAGTQTIPVAVSQAGTNTGPSPVTVELIHDPVVAIVPRTPRNEVGYNHCCSKFY